MAEYLLEVEHLALNFYRHKGFAGQESLSPVVDLSLKLMAGEILAVVGSSGSGKSLLASAVLGILPGNCREQGLIKYRGQVLTKILRQSLRGSDIRLIPQSVSYLNPLYTIGWQLKQAALAAGVTPALVRTEITEAITRYELPESTLKLFPHQLSGGMARRVLTATATMGSPRLLIADEPTTGLDEDLITESLKFLKTLADDGCGILIITHDLSAVTDFADYVTVFIDGLSVETCQTETVVQQGWTTLKHPYSRALWRSLPVMDFWDGLPENSGRHSHGCPFASRCEGCQDLCLAHHPNISNTNEREYVRCHF
ncbi:peptide ABC transporter ATP-binding protein [Deltaproteobacteria bacterium Smac51]|nr:peptide ABC transporter ATP-binding protein [Deltaproteobacteria bacterium Smac51]